MSEPKPDYHLDTEEPLSLEYLIDRIEFRVILGRWRGRLKLSESEGAGLLLLLPEDDGQPQPYGRALEKFLADLLEQTQTRGAYGDG